jgi:hypothetical protein
MIRERTPQRNETISHIKNLPSLSGSRRRIRNEVEEAEAVAEVAGEGARRWRRQTSRCFAFV